MAMRHKYQSADEPKPQPIQAPQGAVTCRHCRASINPVRVKTYGATPWILFIVIVLVGIIFCWPLLFAFWLPLLIYSVHHNCPACGLRLD